MACETSQAFDAQAPASTSACNNSSGDACWVCLGDGDCASTSNDGGNAEPLVCPCACPRPVHAACLARWQLHSAGTPEETTCRFCQGQLPDWKGVLTPAEMRHAGWEESDDEGDEGAKTSTSSPTTSTNSPPRLHPRLRHPAPTMSVTFNGVVHHIVVRGGPDGYAAFVADVRRIFRIDDGHDMQLAFDCADPVSGALVKLNGAGAYQAAVHCAAISAAKRMAAWAKQQKEREAQELREREEAAGAALALASGSATDDGELVAMDEDDDAVVVDPGEAPSSATAEAEEAPSTASSAALDAAIADALSSGDNSSVATPTSAAATTRVTRRSAAAAAAAVAAAAQQRQQQQQDANALATALAAGAAATAAPGDLRRALAEIAGGVRRLRAAAVAAVGGAGGSEETEAADDAATTAAALREVADLLVASTSSPSPPPPSSSSVPVALQ